jgi:CBS-domain-containing membrane protein
MSPRAAWRLEQLGFDSVFDYVLGKADWMAAGLPTERAEPPPERALEAADRDPPTCGVETPVRDLAEEADGDVFVVDEEGVVMGVVRASRRREAGPDELAEDVMQPGPTTARADEELHDLLHRMANAGVAETAVTTPEGRLLGVVRRTP